MCLQSVRVPLTVAAALLVLLDVWVFLDIDQFGFPPNDLLYPDGTIPVASTNDKVAVALLLFVFARFFFGRPTVLMPANSRLSVSNSIQACEGFSYFCSTLPSWRCILT